MDALVLVYDVGARSTFYALPDIYQKVLNLSGKTNVPVVVMANKVDVYQDSQEVNASEGREFAEAIGGIFGECSAREGDRVEELVQQMMKPVVKARLFSLEEKDLQMQSEKEMCTKKPESNKTSIRQRAKRSMSGKLLSRLK